MKKIIALLIFVCAGAALFAQDVKVSVGGGANFTANFTSYTLNKEATDAGIKVSDPTLIGGGVYGFFDATYIEANVGVLFGNYNMKESNSKGLDVIALKIGLFGKYPFELSGAFSVFPLLGVDVMLPLSITSGGEAPTGEAKTTVDKMFTQAWIKLGIGADINATDHIFVRPEFLYGIRFNTDDETKAIGAYNAGKRFSSIFGHGLDIRVAVGYRF